mmetsp:Transcript_2298/g.6848  ORF Transcript_2298/g.6848 Transcript_2298/m.6848 type:complete len:521 (-) Transcript_2298:189-1751(-)
MIMSVSTFSRARGAATTLSSRTSRFDAKSPSSLELPSGVVVPDTGPLFTTRRRCGRVVDAADCSRIDATHRSSSFTVVETSKGKVRTSAKAPRRAEAAAVWGEQRWVRPLRPWRPSKFRFDVDAHRWYGMSLSGFMPRHIEHPGSRHWKPALRKISSRPSASACSLTSPDAGTTRAWTCAGTLWSGALRTTSAAARRSSMRPFVHEPMNTASSFRSSSACPGVRPTYSKARRVLFEASSSLRKCPGQRPSMGTTSCGDVPQVTMGGTASASISTTTSKCASSSLRRLRQCSTASSQPDAGAMGLPFTYANVVSSGATNPARAPASMAMLHMDMRASIERARTADPANSTAVPVHPAAPTRPTRYRIRSFDVTPFRNAPSTVTSMAPGFCCKIVCVASTCSTSDVPMPNASAPNAPCVVVCESPHTIVVPGNVKPCSGPTTCTTPCRGSIIPKYGTPNRSTFSSNVLTCFRAASSSKIASTLTAPLCSARRDVVGTLWSTVHNVQSGRRTGLLASASPSNA